MGKAIPTQHPAVVLRSHFKLVRALLGVTMLAVIGLTIAVVIVANDGDEVGGPAAAARPIESIEYGGFNPATGRPEAAPLPQQAHPLQSRVGSTRYDGGPEEGTRGIVGAQPPATRYDGGPEEGTADVTPAQPRVTQQQAFPGLASQARSARSNVPASQAGTKDYSKNGATGDYAHGPLPPDPPAKADTGFNAGTAAAIGTR